MSNESAFVTELLDGQIFSEQTLLVVHTTNIKVAVERERESPFFPSSNSVTKALSLHVTLY